MPLKEQNGNSQGTTGSQHAKHLRDVKPDIKRDVKPATSTPAAVAWAGLPVARPSGGAVGAGQADVKPVGLPAKHGAAPAKPLVTPKLPAASNRLAVPASDEEEEEVEDIRSTLMSKDELKRSLERRKKRKERAALAAAGN